jgi:hypothetical protein
MKIPKILFNFRRQSDSKFQTRAEAIETAMNGNPNFPAPVPAIADLTDAINAYSAALSGAQSRDRTKIEIKKDMRRQLETLLVNLAASVTCTAAGSRSIMISSGFDVNSGTMNARILGTGENFQLRYGKNPGKVISSINGVANATKYIHQYTPDPVTANSKWTSIYSSSCKTTITGLEPLKRYWFRIIITGWRNQQVQTDAISKTVG